MQPARRGRGPERFNDTSIQRFVQELVQTLKYCGLSVPRNDPRIFDYTGRWLAEHLAQIWMLCPVGRA
eukprot:scaffold10069_cov52-Prasinocladus_malaysianus.AAC.1